MGLDDGRVKLEQALALAQSHGLEDYAGRVFPSTVFCALGWRRFALADAYLERGLEYCRERGLDTWRLYLLACRARLRAPPRSLGRGGATPPGWSCVTPGARRLRAVSR